MPWKKIAAGLQDIPFAENGLAKMLVNGMQICLIKQHDALAACTARCPHAGADLSLGFLTGNKIICPHHGYKFNFNNGENVSGEGYKLKVYRIVANEEGIFIEI